MSASATTPMAIQLACAPVPCFGAIATRKPPMPKVRMSVITGSTRAFQCGRSCRSIRSPSASSRCGYPMTVLVPSWFAAVRPVADPTALVYGRILACLRDGSLLLRLSQVHNISGANWRRGATGVADDEPAVLVEVDRLSGNRAATWQFGAHLPAQRRTGGPVGGGQTAAFGVSPGFGPIDIPGPEASQ